LGDVFVFGEELTFLFVVPFLLQPQDGSDFSIEVDVHFVIKPFF
jgi:hypothetical protein